MSNNRDSRNIHNAGMHKHPEIITANSKIGKSFHKAIKAAKTEREKKKLHKIHWQLRHSSDQTISTNAMIATLDLMLQCK